MPCEPNNIVDVAMAEMRAEETGSACETPRQWIFYHAQEIAQSSQRQRDV